MAGSRIGALKAKEKLLAKNPNHYIDIGGIGGRNGEGPEYKGGFAHPTADPSGSGRKGGKISKRQPKEKI